MASGKEITTYQSGCQHGAQAIERLSQVEARSGCSGVAQFSNVGVS